ncbi:MAG: tmRNA-binding protein SmpB, partial [uncultured Frankineae bacterium]
DQGLGRQPQRAEGPGRHARRPQQAGRPEQEGTPRLRHRGRARGGPRADGDRGQVAAPGALLARRRVRRRAGRRGVPARRPHPGVHRGHLEQPHAPAQPQAAAAPQGDRHPRRPHPRERAGARPAVAVLQGRPRQGRDRRRPRTQVPRQAAGHGRARCPEGDAQRDGPRAEEGPAL